MPGNFDVELEKMAPSSWGLHIRNSGSDAIPELRIELDGTLVHEHPAYVGRQEDRGVVEELSGGDEVAYLLMTKEESLQPPYRLRIMHRDEHGVEHEYSAKIG